MELTKLAIYGGRDSAIVNSVQLAGLGRHKEAAIYDG
jgi:hypothetical protein